MPSLTTANAIADARITASQYLSAAQNIINLAMTKADGGPIIPAAPLSYGMTAVEPAVPEVENSMLTFDSQKDEIIALLSDELAGFFTQYYPLASDAFDEATNWLVNSITNGGTGISPAVEDMIWQRDRDRVIADGARVESQTLNEFASRGYDLPPGVMAHRIVESRFNQTSKLQESSRDAAIKQAEMEVENLRFAVEQAIKSRMAAMGAAADYIKALMGGVDAAAKVASINSDAKARMMAATADLYRARLARDELAMKIPMANQDASIKVSGVNMDGYYKGAQLYAQAAIASAEGWAESASSSLKAVTAIVQESENSFT